MDIIQTQRKKYLSILTLYYDTGRCRGIKWEQMTNCHKNENGKSSKTRIVESEVGKA